MFWVRRWPRRSLATVGTAMWPVRRDRATDRQREVGQATARPPRTAIGRKKWDTALKAIKQAQAVSAAHAYDDYKINELLLYVYLQQGRNAEAAKLLEQQIASGADAAERTHAADQDARAALFPRRQFPEGDRGRQRLPEGRAGRREMQMMVAQGYYQQKNYKSAIAAAERLTRSGQPERGPAAAGATQQLRARGQGRHGQGAARQLLQYYPTPQTWKSLLKTYFNQAKRDPELLALYRLSQDVGALERAQDYIDMAEALIVGGFGAEGQRVLEEGIAAKVFSPEDQQARRSHAWRQRRTRAAEPDRRPGSAPPRPSRPAHRARTCTQPASCISVPVTIRRRPKRCARPSRRAACPTPMTRTCCSASRLARTNRNGDAMKAFDAVKDPKFAEIARVWKLHAS